MSGGLGPTKLMSPLKTFQNWGSSSMLSFRKNFPTLVIRGSFLTLKGGPFHFVPGLQLFKPGFGIRHHRPEFVELELSSV